MLVFYYIVFDAGDGSAIETTCMEFAVGFMRKAHKPPEREPWDYYNPFETADLEERFKRYLSSITAAHLAPKPQFADRTKHLVKSCLHLDKLPATVTTKTFSCHTPTIPTDHAPLVLVVPKTPDVSQYAAYLPALARNAQAWVPTMPWDKYIDWDYLHQPIWQSALPVLKMGYHLDETARGVANISQTCLSFVRDNLPLLDAAQNLARELSELFRLMSGQPPGLAPGTPGWDGAPGELRRTWKAVERYLEVVHREMSNEPWRITIPLKSQIFELQRMVQLVQKEMKGLDRGGDVIHGCSTCLGHIILVMEDISRALLEMHDILTNYETILWTSEMKYWDKIGARLVPNSVPKLESAAVRAHKLPPLIREIMARVQRWGEVMADVEVGWMELTREWEVNLGKET